MVLLCSRSGLWSRSESRCVRAMGASALRSRWVGGLAALAVALFGCSGDGSSRRTNPQAGRDAATTTTSGVTTSGVTTSLPEARRAVAWAVYRSDGLDVRVGDLAGGFRTVTTLPSGAVVMGLQ